MGTQDQAILITGAGRGLGRATAEFLARCGARVGACDIDAARCAETVEAIRESGGRAADFAFDAADRDAFLAAAAQFAQHSGRIDAVVNNAMLLRYEPIEEVREDVVDRMLGVGIKGSLWGAQALLKHMDKERGGAIVNMASPVAEKGFPNTAVYSLVKGALVTLTKTLSAELGPRKVRVNAVAPGSVPTPGAPRPQHRRGICPPHTDDPAAPAGHAADDNAQAVAFLLSPAASFINGEILHVDGGIAAAG